MQERNISEASAVEALATAARGAMSVSDKAKPFVLLPAGYEMKDAEQTLQHPTRKRGTVNVRDSESFIALVNAQATDATVLYRTVEPPKFVAVFNDHGTSSEHQAGWGDHRAVYDCPVSPEWKAWKGSDKKQMSQAEFAQFIEDNLPDLVDPTAAEMLEISRTLQAKKKVNFASGIRLDNGQTQFTYEEKIDGTAGGKGQLRVPEVFKIGVPVFEGGPRYAVNARLRYRISDAGVLTMWYDLERPHKIIEDAVQELRKVIEAGTSRPTINGER